MKKYLKLFLIFSLPLIIGCKNKKNTSIKKNKKMEKAVHIDDQLKDDVHISKSFIDGLEFNTYKYNGEYIEQISIRSLEDKTFREDFFKFLTSRNFDKKQYEQTFFIKLLLVRIQQLDDLRSYNLLSQVFNNEGLGYYLENYELYLFQLFLYKPYFFIKGEYKYKEDQLTEYIIQGLPAAFLTNKKYFDNNIVEIQIHEDALLISKSSVERFTIEKLKRQIEQKANRIEAFFSPTFDTEWKSKTIVYYNLYNYMNESTITNLDKNELLLYNIKYKPFFNSYIIKGQTEVLKIEDPDGYTNLRRNKNISSEILQKVKSGEPIEVLDNTSDWFLVKTKEGKEGYIHKSRVRSK